MHIKQIEMLTSDVEGLRGYYRDVVGLQAIGSDAAAEFQAGTTRLIFRAAPAGWQGMYHFAFHIPARLFRAAKAWAAEALQVIRDRSGQDEFQHHSWQARAIYFVDPTGNIGELIAADRSDQDPGDTFDGRQILAVSEIGLACDDVQGLTQRLIERIQPRDLHGPGSDTFRSLGDNKGRLILVRTGRTWFPDTGIAAVAVQTRVLVEETGGRQYWVSGPPFDAAPATAQA